jgi:hypothetical protein
VKDAHELVLVGLGEARKRGLCQKQQAKGYGNASGQVQGVLSFDS